MPVFTFSANFSDCDDVRTERDRLETVGNALLAALKEAQAQLIGTTTNPRLVSRKSLSAAHPVWTQMAGAIAAAEVLGLTAED